MKKLKISRIAVFMSTPCHKSIFDGVQHLGIYIAQIAGETASKVIRPISHLSSLTGSSTLTKWSQLHPWASA